MCCDTCKTRPAVAYGTRCQECRNREERAARSPGLSREQPKLFSLPPSLVNFAWNSITDPMAD